MPKIYNPHAPIPFRVNGNTTLVFELFIENNSREKWQLVRVEILNECNGLTIETWDQNKVKANIRYLNQTYRPAESEELLPERIGLVFFWLSFEPSDETPTHLSHRLTLTSELGEQRVERVDIHVQTRKPLVIEPPLRGERWLAAEAASNTTGHRRTPLYIDGAPYFAQRYAVDWLQFGPDWKLFKGAPEMNENWYCYGAEIHAVADGLVIEIQEGIIENVPLSEKMAVEINLQSAPGNYVLIDHGGDNFALYAHMLPGSISVKEGEQVKAGQVIGNLGNSGNSGAPHLHFHIGHRKSPLGTHGVPYHLQSFERLGNVGTTEQLTELVETGESWQPKDQLQHHREEYMVSNDVLNL
jgi:hypothetical protein